MVSIEDLAAYRPKDRETPLITIADGDEFGMLRKIWKVISRRDNTAADTANLAPTPIGFGPHVHLYPELALVWSVHSLEMPNPRQPIVHHHI